MINIVSFIIHNINILTIRTVNCYVMIQVSDYIYNSANCIIISTNFFVLNDCVAHISIVTNNKSCHQRPQHLVGIFLSFLRYELQQRFFRVLLFVIWHMLHFYDCRLTKTTLPAKKFHIHVKQTLGRIKTSKKPPFLPFQAKGHILGTTFKYARRPQGETRFRPFIFAFRPPPHLPAFTRTSISFLFFTIMYEITFNSHIMGYISIVRKSAYRGNLLFSILQGNIALLGADI